MIQMKVTKKKLKVNIIWKIAIFLHLLIITLFKASKKSKIIIPGLLVNAQKPSIVSKLNQQDEIKSPRLLARAAKAEENATPLKKTNSKTENVESNLRTYK